MTTTNDPYDAASTATLAPRTYFGQLLVEAWFCVLQKGVGKLPYDAAQHRAEDRRTALDVSVLPLVEQNVSFEIKRDMIAESREWAAVVWPSLKELGLTGVRDANNAWVKMVQVPSGRKYRNSAGEEKEATTFKFLGLYANEDECRAAYFAEGGTATEAEPTSAPANGNGNGNGSHTGLPQILPFIKAFAMQNQYDLEATKAVCEKQPIITNVIDVNSPEFAQIVFEAMAGAK